MFAIQITEENMPQILESVSPKDPDVHYINTFLANRAEWYVITGYVSRFGKFHDWVILPAYVLVSNYEYDKDKIRTTWDQIVRK